MKPSMNLKRKLCSLPREVVRVNSKWECSSRSEVVRVNSKWECSRPREAVRVNFEMGVFVLFQGRWCETFWGRHPFIGIWHLPSMRCSGDDLLSHSPSPALLF